MLKILANVHRAILKSALAEYVAINNKQIKIVHFGEWLSVDPDSGAPVTSTEPKICVRLSDVIDSDLEINKDVILRNKKYCIADIQKDGEGIAELILKKTR
jgi:hypothetical protein